MGAAGSYVRNMEFPTLASEPSTSVSIDDPEVILSADRNSSVSIPLLPADIVRLIFELDAYDHPIQRYGHVAVKDTWLRLGQVCLAWRVILFDMPNIWARDIFQFRLERALSLLPLAQQSHLNLDLWSTSTKSDVVHSLYSLVARSSRITYTRQNATWDLFALFKILSKTSLPHLGALSISVYETRHKYTLQSIARHHNLRCLTLENVFIRPPFGSSLRALSLAFPSLKPVQRPALRDLLELISHCDGLETLVLKNAFFQDIDVYAEHAAVAGQAKLTLPALTSLTLKNEDILSMLLLDHLLVPALQEATIRLTSYPGPLVALSYAIIRSLLRAWIGVDGVDVPRSMNTMIVQNSFDGELHPVSVVEELGGVDRLVSEASGAGVAVAVKERYRGARIFGFVFEVSV
ncbi:hypothetical protein PENSPDRAFT_759539 [Peniophora sp. CONT]|nr:hypothetical protein PENSPDRAFT_759539 [Peniophora sp. CONT]